MEPEKKMNGALVGLVVIIIILIIGGIYMWQSNKNAMNKQDLGAQEGAVTDEDSSNLNQLDADIQTTDTNSDIDVNAVY